MHYFNTLAAWNDISGGPSVASFAKAAVMRSVRFVCHSVCLSVCVHDYCKSNQPVLLRLAVMIGPTSRKNWLNFGSDPVSDTDSGSRFPLPSPLRNRGLVFLIQSQGDIHDIRRFSASNSLYLANDTR